MRALRKTAKASHLLKMSTTANIDGERVSKLIDAFRMRGHFAASLDPLSAASGQMKRVSSWLHPDEQHRPDVVRLLRDYPKLDLRAFNLQNTPTDIRFEITNDLKCLDHRTNWTITELVAFLRRVYCGSVGIEFTHIENEEQRAWLERKVESQTGPRAWCLESQKEKYDTLNHLIRCDLTAEFLNAKFPAAKVFGVEGCEALIPGLYGVVEAASAFGLEAIEMGMAHRGRMNVLHNFFQKPLHSIFNYFGESEPSELGDVKYHLGTRGELHVLGTDGEMRSVHLSLAANPSHLEAVNPIVIGRTKAKQFFIRDETKRKVMPILLHGDAAFSGQGIVPEVMELSDLPDYTVGGCVHIVVNNQIGFTTDPRVARSSYHCTNVAKGIGAPIFHVNGDDVEAVVRVCRLAAEWRQYFLRDCVVDLVCYRRHGHNSLDDPSITQPVTYALIKQHPTVLEIYSRKMINAGIVTEDDFQVIRNNLHSQYEDDYARSKLYVADPLEWLASNWLGKALGSMVSGRPYNQTGCKMEILKQVGSALTTVPQDFVLHKDIEKLIKSRKRMIESGEGITMAFAESLAFGCLMSAYTPDSVPAKDGDVNGAACSSISINRVSVATSAASLSNALDIQMKAHPMVHIRLSGQDCIRGTFNQRHAAIVCQSTGRNYWQLNNMGIQHATLTVCNSSLSEAAILGFEYGYSLSNEMALTVWEAQFGDFANVAQSIIDNFIASGESKWNNQSSLVLLLPHGYDGQGPEHSSARLERFLQLVDDDPDAIPGLGSFSRGEMEAGFDAMMTSHSSKVAEAVDIPGNSASLVTSSGNTIPSTKSGHSSSNTMASKFSSNDGISSAGSNRYVETVDSSRGRQLKVRGFARDAFVRAALRYEPDLEIGRIDLALAELLTETMQLQPPIGEEDEAGTEMEIELTKETWCQLMSSWLQSNSERRHNLIVVVPSTPAQYFHCLRRQIHRPFAKPLVVMSPKWLLHHKPCQSRLEDLATGTFFQRLIIEGGIGDNMKHLSTSNSDVSLVSPSEIRRVVFCSGKIFYHLFHARAAARIRDITFIRLEQIAPFPYDLVGPAIELYPNAEIIWAQEEPKNMGAWAYVKPRFDTAMREAGIDRRLIRYIGRKPSASAATGGYKVHAQEQKEIVDAVVS